MKVAGERSAADLAVGLVCAALGLGMVAWLVTDLADGESANAFLILARVASSVFWFALAAIVLDDRARTAGLVAVGTCVAVLLVALAIGLLGTPDDFTNTTGKGPHTAGQARGLGALLATAVVAGSGWLFWRFWRVRRRSEP